MTTLILAPHVDDEMIGCWSLLSLRRINPKAMGELHIAWFFGLSEERQQEALRVASEFSATPHFGLMFSDLDEIKPSVVYVPAITDQHSEHKLLNSQWRSKATHFYSIDMVRSKPLAPHFARAKKRDLDSYYPSQKSLWEKDAKYYLFEDITSSDLTRKVSVEIGDKTLTVSGEYAHLIAKEYEIRRRNGVLSPEALIDMCLAISAGQAHVTVRDNTLNMTWSVN